jgi:hypothetical protein
MRCVDRLNPQDLVDLAARGGFFFCCHPLPPSFSEFPCLDYLSSVRGLLQEICEFFCLLVRSADEIAAA